jgi:hypothetical protein
MTKKTVQTFLSVAETENTITTGSAAWDGNFHDRLNYDRSKILNMAITAWRENPIARRIIEITSEFVLGDGFGISSENPGVLAFLNRFWNHELNDLDSQLKEWADEAWRSGDLFLLFSIDAGGFPLVRAIPAETITEIVTTSNDYRQETAYKRNPFDEQPYPAYQPGTEQETFMLHFALNRAVGSSFGESDLAPVLHWLGTYRKWLEDRAQLNYFRQMFAFVMQRSSGSQADKEAYKHDFIAKLPKKGGSVLFIEPNETLSTLSPELGSSEANEDGLALKRMIATGAGLPMHYLSEPESSTRTTAEAAGTPTFKRFKSRQKFLQNAVTHVLTVAMETYRVNGGRMPEKPEFKVTTPDITERDNANLAIAVQRIVNAIAPLYNSKIISTQEFTRIVYRFLAESQPKEVPNGFTPIKPRPAAGKSDTTGSGKEEIRG